MSTHHELLQGTVAQNRNVMSPFRIRRLCIFRGKQFFRSRFLRDVIADHRDKTMQTADLAKFDLLYYSHSLRKRGLFDIVENDMTEMKDDPARPQTELNNVPLYQARWPKGKVVDGVYVPGEIGSGWRRDQADTVALAIRMNGHVVRGYFAGTI